MYNTRLLAILVFLFGAFSMCCGVSLYPTSLSTQKGSTSSVALSALQTKDQSGSQDTWNKYVEFYGSDAVYQGVFTFDASDVETSEVTSFALNVNFRGPQKSEQVWEFEWLQPSSNTWVAAGDNSAAGDWKWTSFSLAGSGAFSSLVSQGKVQLRLSSKTKGDDCDLDFLELVLTVSTVSGSQPTQQATAAPTQHATAAPTTPAPTSHATAAPTSHATAAPTSHATAAPTSKPTTKPTSAPTSAPTTRPSTTGSSSSSGRVCPTGTHYRPGPGTTWQWQLSGTVDTSFNVQVYDIDMFGSSTTLISSLHSAGRAVVCYIDTAYEPGRPDSSSFTAAVLGNGIDGWPGQKWVDIRSTVVRNIMVNRISQAAAKGCDAVEMDDVDSYENNPGFPLTAADQLDFNNFLATTAHSYDLGIALKNDIDQVTQLAVNFDFAINEQCFEYDECSALSTFINQGKAVFGVEYDLSTSQFCSQANADQFSWLKKDLDLDASMTQCCPTCSGTHTCVASTSSRSVREVQEEALVEEALSAEAVEATETENTFHSSGAKISGFASVVVIATLFVALF